MFGIKNVFSRLPDFLRKKNNYKLLSIFTEQFEKLHTTINRVGEWRDIDNAEGTTLDDIGTNVNQPRGRANDEVYRILLKSKIARNLSDGTINTIIRVIATALSVPKNQIKIQEKWHDEYEPEAAAIKLIEMPLAKINEAGMDPRHFVAIVQKTVAGGVKVEAVELSGTFEFGSVSAASNTDTTKGFGSVNDPSVGGHFGAVYTQENIEDLPI